MQKLLALAALVSICAGCKPTYQPICPEVYAKQVRFVNAQWHAGHITTSAATSRLDDLDASLQVWVDDHFLRDEQKTLIQSTKKSEMVVPVKS